MLTYDELYEFLRKERFGDKLQKLPKDFVTQFSDYADAKKKQFKVMEGDSFNDDLLRERKQYENAITLFKDLMLRRKKKILDLVFVAAETGIMKKDFADMLVFEKELFEKLVKAIDDGDKALKDLMNGGSGDVGESENTLVIITDDVEEFVDMNGNAVGPFGKGNVANLDPAVAEILIGGSKARLVDEKE